MDCPWIGRCPRMVRLTLLLSCLSVWVCSGAPHRMKVDDPRALEQLRSQGARILADYESFQIVEIDFAAAMPRAGVESKPEWDRIQLNAGPIVTRGSQRVSMAAAPESVTNAGMRLVQFVGPIQPDWMSGLLNCGVRVVNHIPHNAYLVYGDADALGRLQSWAASNPVVQWEGAFETQHKLDPVVRNETADVTLQSVVEPTWVAVQLLEVPGINSETLALIDQLRLAPIRRQFETLHFLNAVVALPPNRIEELAARPDVVSIRPYREPAKRDERQSQILAGNVIGGMLSGPGYLDWLESKGFNQEQFDASGFVVDVTDSGIDNGTTTPGHFALHRLGQSGAGSRVAYSRLEGSPNFLSTLQGCDGHGTLNAHLIAGYSAFAAGFPHADAEGYAYGLGVCPFVKVGASVIFDPDTFTNPNYRSLQSRAYQSGARISANSWGAGGPGEYDIEAQAYDALVRDAQPVGAVFSTAGNQQMVIVFAAGNAGPGARTIDSPGSAKNVITVGASESVRSLKPGAGGNNGFGFDACSTPDSEADNTKDLLTFSGRGPTADGRMKPDLVAPGSHVTAGAPQAGSPTTAGVGSALACFDATGLCALEGSGTEGRAENFFPLSQQFYTVSSGTSHAVPAVAGACALLRQYFINHVLPPPSPAMTRAFLMNSARYLNGAEGSDNLWSPRQGMGVLNLGTALDGVPRILRDQVTAEKFTASGQTRHITGVVSDPGKPFRVTLAWTDAPGSTVGDAFNNDLDLTVTIGGITYRGNVFNGDLSVPGGASDFRNNVESVFLPPGITGSFLVTVRASNINSDGVPNEAPLLDQDFALVVYNAVEASVPVFQIVSQEFLSESCESNGVADAGESIVVGVALANVGMGHATNVTMELIATNGILFPGVEQHYGDLAPGTASVAEPFQFVVAGECGSVIRPTFRVAADGLDAEQIGFNLFVGETNSMTTRFTNSLPIVISSVGPANPYPSSITVSNLTGTVSAVTVTLAGVGHAFPADIDVVLVGPQGDSVVLMSDAGDDLNIFNATLVFDDRAANSLPPAGRIVSGTYKPTNYGAADDGFPGLPGPHGTALSVFNGSNPNGTWLLYVQDDAPADSGSINSGWRLGLTTLDVTCCPGAIVIQSVAIEEGTVMLTWTAVPGRTYRVEARSESGSEWQILEPEVFATSSVAAFSEPVADGPRFYRIVLAQ